MTQIVDLANVREFLTRHLIDVFDTMLSMKVAVVPCAAIAPEGEHVSGSVGFTGDNVTGVIYLRLSARFAKQAAATMLGVNPEQLSQDREVNDAIGEVTNMLTGGLKSWMCDVGARCSMSTPAVRRSASFSAGKMPGVQQDRLVFDCGSEKVIVEIHIKLN